MNTAPDLTTSATITATDQTKAAEAPRITLQSHGFAIDHQDQELGERLMANALGVTDREAMHGMIRQLVKASVSGEKPRRGQPRFHDFDGEEHQAPGFHRITVTVHLTG